LIVREGSGGRIERKWAFRFTAPDGKRAVMDMALVGDMTLAKAREKARDYRLGLADGIDPRLTKKLQADGGKTFKEYADEKIPGWCVGHSPEEEKQWRRSIRDVPSLHAMKLHAIDTPHVVAALEKFWTKKPVTANRTRQRIERLLNAAKVEKLRAGENPAIWRGNLEYVFKSARKLNKKKGHPTIHYDQAPALIDGLACDPGRVARCVEVGILTVTRSQEIRLMEWTELNFEKKTWLIPAHKMKIKGQDEPKPHLVPLSDQAIAIIQSMPKVGKYVFPSDHAETHQSFRPNALVGAIRRAGFAASMHGMRTTFRNWGGESVEHNFRREVLEHCLSHRVGDEAEKSYWTGEMIERRRIALQAWADYVLPKRKPRTTPKHKPELTLVKAA
jgi:integrase